MECGMSCRIRENTPKPASTMTSYNDGDLECWGFQPEIPANVLELLVK
jgi:hypothetical protein